MEGRKLLFGDLKKKNINPRKTRQEQLAAQRQDQRHLLLQKQRKIEKSPVLPPPVVKKSRAELLKEWKEQRQKKEKDTNTQKKKPPFRVGKLQTKATGSPMTKPLRQIENLPKRAGVSTRSQTRKAPTALQVNIPNKKPPAGFRKMENNNKLKTVKKHDFVFKHVKTGLTIPNSPKITKSARKRMENIALDEQIKGKLPKRRALIKDEIKTEEGAKSPVLNTFDELGVTKIAMSPLAVKISNKYQKAYNFEAFGVTKIALSPLAMPNNNVNLANGQKPGNTPASSVAKLICSPIKMPISQEKVSKSPNLYDFQDSEVSKMAYSPTTEAPQQSSFAFLEYSPNITKERGKKRKSRISQKIPDVDDEIKQEELLRIAKIQEFRLFITNETTRLTNLANSWSEYLEIHPETPDDFVGDAKAAIGKTALLTSDKFQQFAGIITHCENLDPKIKIDDLQGFHDWVELEVFDLDKCFQLLEKSRARNWEKEEVVVAVKKVVRKAKTKVVAAKPRTGALAQMIAAKRKMMEGTADTTTSNPTLISTPIPSTSAPVQPMTPVITPLRSCRGCTPTPKDRSSLREHVLRRNAGHSGLFMLAATASARTSLSPSPVNKLEPSSTPPLTLATPQTTTHQATPIKGILKSGQTSAKKAVAFKTYSPSKLAYLFQPAEDTDESSDGSPHILDLCPTTPVRRSERIASKSAEKKLR